MTVRIFKNFVQLHNALEKKGSIRYAIMREFSEMVQIPTHSKVVRPLMVVLAVGNADSNTAISSESNVGGSDTAPNHVCYYSQASVQVTILEHFCFRCVCHTPLCF